MKDPRIRGRDQTDTHTWELTSDRASRAAGQELPCGTGHGLPWGPCKRLKSSDESQGTVLQTRCGELTFSQTPAIRGPPREVTGEHPQGEVCIPENQPGVHTWMRTHAHGCACVHVCVSVCVHEKETGNPIF